MQVKFRYILSVLCTIVVVATAMAIRLSNPAMTETQLLMNFWWAWILLAVIGIVGIVLIDK